MSKKDDHSEFYREDWMTDAQWECACLFADLVGGFHHVSDKFKPSYIDGVEINTRQTFATFDCDGLTRLVVLAHDRCIRVEICSSGPGRIRLMIHKRDPNGKHLWARHPKLMDAIKRIGRQHAK
jgi:hypothetical protein